MFAVACSNGVQPPVDGTPPPVETPAIVVEVGGETTIVYGSYQSKRLGLRLTAGDTVDIGLWVVPGSDLSNLVLRQSIAALPLGTTVSTATWFTIYPAVVVSKSATYVFEVTGGFAYCSGGPPGSCVADGSFTMRVRKSQPIVLVASNWLDRLAFAQPPKLRNVLEKFAALSYRSPESGQVVDTLWVRNAGAGAISFGVAAGPSLQVSPASSTVPGPSRGWTPEEGAVPVVVRKNGQLPLGVYVDTLTYAGTPIDVWNAGAVSASPLTLLVHEERGMRHPGAAAISIAKNQLGEIFMGFETLYRLDPQGALVALQTFPGNLLADGGFVVGPDTALYAVIFVRPTTYAHTLYRIARGGTMTTIVPEVPGNVLAVLPDLSMFFVNQSTNVMTRRSPSGDMQQVLSYPADPVGTYPRRFRGLLFNPVDSALFWMFDRALMRRDLRANTESMLGDFGMATPQYVDSRGYLYLSTPLATSSYLNFLTVVNRSGTIVDHRYPPVTADKIVIRGDTIFIVSSGAYWTLPP